VTICLSTPLETDTNLTSLQKRARKNRRSFDKVWTYVIMGDILNAEHYKATCYHCNKVWTRGKPSVLKAHLANECLNTPKDISKYWRNKIAENNVTYTRNPYLNNQ
jgi:hypothetical protein